VKGSIDSRQVAIIAGAAVIAALFLALGMGLLNPGPAELDERELTDLPQVETQPYELETNIIPVQEGLDFGGSGDYSQDEDPKHHGLRNL
jgi:hypothetical protein